MAKAGKKKAKSNKKSARVTAKPKAAVRSAKPAKKKASKPSGSSARKKTAARKIDPLNRTHYRAVTPMLAVRDVRRAMNFYTAAFGFKVKASMGGPGGVIVHAELTLRDTTLMLSPEEPKQNALSAKAIGNTPVTLYVLVENVDKVFGSAVAAGGQVAMPVMDMFWGDRCGMVNDPDGNKWMIATHKSEPTEAEMAKAMQQMMQEQAHHAPESAAAAAAGGAFETEY